MSLRQSAASRNNSLSQPTHKPGVIHREGAAEQRASPRTRLQQSNRLRGPIENISSPGLTRNSIGYGPNAVHGHLQRCCPPLHYPVNEAGSSLQNRGSKCNQIDRYRGDIEVSEIRKRGEVADNDDFTSRRASMKNMDDWSKSCGVKICDI